MYIWSCIVLLSWTIVILSVILFFFKQKTAYEMRISDWSSDVCSSDLSHASGCRPPDRSACCHDRRAGHPALPKHCRGSGGLSRLTHGRHPRHGLPWEQTYFGSLLRAAEPAPCTVDRLACSPIHSPPFHVRYSQRST